jgi:hypothetical protein
MSGNSTDSSPMSLPNPFTPLAFVPPDLAYQIEIGRYILVGGIAASSSLHL